MRGAGAQVAPAQVEPALVAGRGRGQLGGAPARGQGVVDAAAALEVGGVAAQAVGVARRLAPGGLGVVEAARGLVGVGEQEEPRGRALAGGGVALVGAHRELVIARGAGVGAHAQQEGRVGEAIDGREQGGARRAAASGAGPAPR